MITVHNNELVVEEKGVYSIEKFLGSQAIDVLAGLFAQNRTGCRKHAG